VKLIIVFYETGKKKVNQFFNDKEGKREKNGKRNLIYIHRMKTSGVDFTNVFACIFRTRFSYEYLFSSYVLRKNARENVGEIDPRREKKISHTFKIRPLKLVFTSL